MLYLRRLSSSCRILKVSHSVSLIFCFPDSAKYNNCKHMYLFLFFSRLCLSGSVQGADTVSSQAVAHESDVVLNRDPLSRLLCIPMRVRSNLISFNRRGGGKYIRNEKKK